MAHQAIKGDIVHLTVVRSRKYPPVYGQAVRTRLDGTFMRETKTRFELKQAEVPLLLDGHTTPVFAGIRLLCPSIPICKTKIYCIQSQRDVGDVPWTATHWTPKVLWNFANNAYCVTRYVAGKAVTTWQFRGIFDLSRRFASSQWNNDGVIYTSGQETYVLTRITGSKGHAPRKDPRVPQAQLEEQFRGQSRLPQS